MMDISILITAYNYGNYIEECIDSCLNQDKSGLAHEVIVVDDGSTDNTPEILNGCINRSLRKYRIKNSGIEKASNYGFKKAKGKYIVRVDADDRLCQNYLSIMQSQLTYFAGFYYPDYAVINADGKIVESISLPDFRVEEIRQRGDFLATGTLYDAGILKKYGGYSTVIKNSGLENYELVLRLIELGMVGKHVSHQLFGYRRHGLNISDEKRHEIIRNGQALFEDMKLGSYTTNEYHPYKLKVDVE